MGGGGGGVGGGVSEEGEGMERSTEGWDVHTYMGKLWN